MEKINFRNIEEYKKKDFALYNQLMIDKAIKEGYLEFLPVKKISNKSIGEWIELKYNQLYNEEFDRYYQNGWLNEYDRLIGNKPKITKKNSLLYTKEWILAAKKLGIPIPNRKVCNRENYSLGELLELTDYRRQINEIIENENIDEILKNTNKKRIKVKLKITKVTRKKMVYYEE